MCYEYLTIVTINKYRCIIMLSIVYTYVDVFNLRIFLMTISVDVRISIKPDEYNMRLNNSASSKKQRSQLN